MASRRLPGRLAGAAFATIALVASGPLPASAAPPTTVTVFGDFQSELGCAADFDPGCAATHLVDNSSGSWSATFTIPAGTWHYYIAIDDSLDETYGAGGTPGGDALTFTLADPASVTFAYDADSHMAGDSAESPLITLAGDFQSELGCTGDFAPACLKSWMTDPDGDGIYEFSTAGIPPGDYGTVVAHNLSFTERYGLGGVPGENVPFVVPAAGTTVHFSYVLATHILTITVGDPGGPPGGVGVDPPTAAPILPATGGEVPSGAAVAALLLLVVGAVFAAGPFRSTRASGSWPGRNE